MDIKIKKYDPEISVIIPEFKTDGSAGLDLCSSSGKVITISSSEVKLIPTNLIIELPEGFEGQVRPRSGLALKHSVTVLNSPGTIDSDYRGEVKVLLINHGKNDFEVKYGDRIAQLVIAKYEKVKLIESQDVTETERGVGGYGSTGIS